MFFVYRINLCLCLCPNFFQPDTTLILFNQFLSKLGSFALSNWYTETEKIGLIHSVECNGTEESIFDCQTNEGEGGCLTHQDASVICQGRYDVIP